MGDGRGLPPENGRKLAPRLRSNKLDFATLHETCICILYVYIYNTLICVLASESRPGSEDPLIVRNSSMFRCKFARFVCNSLKAFARSPP